MTDASALIPAITDQDIEWVCDLMHLDAPDEARRAFLTADNTRDVSACPGSGKTTLVVAKLAILSRKWPYRTKGICVLSHTNVARKEIQRRLGDTAIGQRLLSYPHFIDTIHGFVNRFLALPWLRSNGYPSPTIDDDVTTAIRRSKLKKWECQTVQTFLEKKGKSFDRLRICSRDLTFDLGGKAFGAGPSTPSYTLAKRAIESAARAGYFCYDEMLVWGQALLEDCPDVASWLRRRFPLVLLDEMQDTFALQGNILHAVFPRQSADVIVQRVGDPNQAIFDDVDRNRDENDPFPDVTPSRHLSIPNSYRFGPEIAALASPLAIRPMGASGLCGIGPRSVVGAPTACENAIFIFPDNSTDGVLDAYGRHVLRTFDDAALTCGMITAVGAVHRDEWGIGPGHKQFPKSVPHYWSGYRAEMAQREPHPSLLIQYIRAAQAAVQDGQDLSLSVERLASGLIRLAGCVGNGDVLGRRMRTHRTIVDVLKASPSVFAIYRKMITSLLIDRAQLTEENWNQIYADALSIACALCDCERVVTANTPFLAWSGDGATPPTDAPCSQIGARPNVYRVVDGDRSVDIQLGSIHSVKGQTHLATLLLSTYWYDHSSKQILPWLLGDKVNLNGSGTRNRERLLQTYVAMTRPSHMICLTLCRSALGSDEARARHIVRLGERGWRVAEIKQGALEWCE